MTFLDGPDRGLTVARLMRGDTSKRTDRNPTRFQAQADPNRPRRGETAAAYLRRTTPPPVSRQPPSPFPNPQGYHQPPAPISRTARAALMEGVEQTSLRDQMELRRWGERTIQLAIGREMARRETDPGMRVTGVPLTFKMARPMYDRDMWFTGLDVSGGNPRTLRNILQDVEGIAGGPPGYLTGLAGRESNASNADAASRAKNPNSSASGVAQFTDATFYTQVVRNGWRYGIPTGEAPPEYARATPEQRRQILELRDDNRISGAMAVEYAREGRDQIRQVLPNHAVSMADLRVYHFAGGAGPQVIRAYHTGRRGDVALSFYDRRAIEANTANFFPPLRDSSGRVVRETYITPSGDRATRNKPDRHHPFTLEQHWRSLVGDLPETPAEWRPRRDGTD